MVHVLWIREDYENNRKFLCYRHSTDSGLTWGPMQIIYENEWDIFLSVTTSKRMSVSGEDVHIVMASKDEIFYFRSRNGGDAFEDPVTLLSAQPNQNIYDLIIDSEGTGILILYMASGLAAASIDTFCSTDAGNSFRHTLITGDLDWRWWKVCDALYDGEHLYVLWLYNYWQYGSTIQGDLRLGVSTDGGQYFDWKLISVPSLNGLHRTEWLQFDNYVPKIAADGPDVYITWTGRDYDDLMSVFVRHSPDYGVTFNEAINITRDQLAPGQSVYASLESVYAKGGHVYSLFQTTDSRVYLRAGGGNFGSVIPVTASPGTPYVSAGWWPQAVIDPSDESGMTLHAIFNKPQYVKTTDGGLTIHGPAPVGPHYNWQSATKRPRLAAGNDGIVHVVVEGCVKIHKDVDIFYRRIVPTSETTNQMALDVYADPYPADRNGFMAIPSAHQLQFTDKFTIECWVNPDPDTYKQTRIVTKENTETSLFYSPTAYQMGTHEYSGQRATNGGIKTNDGVFMAWGGFIPEGQWTHMALTYDKNAGPDNLILYLNGEVSAKTSASGDIPAGDGLLIVGATRPDDNYNGLIDDLRLWNDALSQEVIQQLMYLPATGNEPGLAACYPMDGNTRDITPFRNDGYLTYVESFVPHQMVIPDSDSDGVDDLEERGFNGLDVAFDGNGDGTPDWKQSNVASLKSYNESQYFTLDAVSPARETIPLINVTSSAVPPGQPDGYEFPYDMVRFSLEFPAGTATALVHFYPHGSGVYDTYVNYGELPGNTAPVFYGFKLGENTGAVLETGVITLHFSDGLRGDHDLTINGSMTTLGGPGRAPEGINDPGQPGNMQVYPNPVSRFLEVRFVAQGRSHTSLTLHNALGERIAVLVDEISQAGEHTYRYDTHHLPQGIYYCRLTTAHSDEIRKVLVLR